MPDRAAIPGADGPGVADVTDILSGRVTPGKRVLLIDRLGFHEATSTAEFMAEQGCEVEVVTQTLYVGQDLGVTLDLENWYRQARRLGITCTPNHSVLGIEDRVVTALHNYSGQIVQFPPADTIVLAIHRRADCQPLCGAQGPGAGTSPHRRLRGAATGARGNHRGRKSREGRLMTTPVVVVAETGYGELTQATLECVEEARDVADSLATSVHVLLPGRRRGGDGGRTRRPRGGSGDGGGASRRWPSSPPTAGSRRWRRSCRRRKPTLTLAPDSGYGRAWLPRLSARWRIPMATACIRIKVTDEGYPEVFRVSHNGKLHERQIWARGTAVMVMLWPGVRGVGPGRAGPAGRCRASSKPDLDPSSFRDRTLRTLPPDPHDVDLTEAERIVSGGLGVGGPEGMAQLQQLADELKASLGGTRVVADRGWLAPDRFIGTTGKIVAPKLYLALGVSGAGQHVAGIGRQRNGDRDQHRSDVASAEDGGPGRGGRSARNRADSDPQAAGACGRGPPVSARRCQPKPLEPVARSPGPAEPELVRSDRPDLSAREVLR